MRLPAKERGPNQGPRSRFQGLVFRIQGIEFCHFSRRLPKPGCNKVSARFGAGPTELSPSEDEARRSETRCWQGRVQELIRSGHERQEVKNKMLERRLWEGGVTQFFGLR